MTPQLQEIKDRLSKIESDTAETRKMLENVETEQKAGPWRPENASVAYRVAYDDLKQMWTVKTCRVFHDIPDCITYIEMGAYFRTEAEALEVAAQRQFLDEDRNAGDLAPDAEGLTFHIQAGNLMVFYSQIACYGRRKFSTRKLLNAFIEKWGGEKAVAERLSKGWR